MLNAVQFASSKSVATNGMLKSAMFNEKGERKGYSEFKRDAKAITDISNDTWLRVEYDCAVMGAVNGEKFRSYRENADIYEYWLYLETTSLHPREQHLSLVGNIYRIGDPEGDACHPQNGFNCGCGSEQVDSMYLEENGLSARTNEEAKEDLANHVPPQFRYNAADQGILPREGHSYFKALPSANEANGETFGITGISAQKTKLAAKGLHLMVETLHKWKHEYKSNVQGDITFQNENTLTNITFNNSSFKTIQKHPQGFDELAETVTKPTEIWSRWQNVHEQQVTLRNYIRKNYIVQTTDGVITDAFLIDNVNRFRIGVILP